LKPTFSTVLYVKYEEIPTIVKDSGLPDEKMYYEKIELNFED